MDETAPHGGLAYMRDLWEQAARSPLYEDAIHVAPSGSFDASGRDHAVLLLDLIPASMSLVVVEYGCGSGRVTQWLAGKYHSLHAFDLSPTMLRRLAARKLERVIPHLTSGAELSSLMGERVDVVYSSLTLMHNRKEDVVAIFQAFRKSLVQGGKVAFQLPVYDVGSEASDWRSMGVWTADELRLLAADTGFQVLRLMPNTGEYRTGWPGPNHFQLHVFRRP